MNGNSNLATKYGKDKLLKTMMSFSLYTVCLMAFNPAERI